MGLPYSGFSEFFAITSLAWASMAYMASLAPRPTKCKLRSTRVNSPEIVKKIEGLVCAYTYLSLGYFSLLRFTDMTKLLSFFILVDRVEVLLLLVFTDLIGLLSLVRFTDMTKLGSVPVLM